MQAGLSYLGAQSFETTEDGTTDYRYLPALESAISLDVWTCEPGYILTDLWRRRGEGSFPRTKKRACDGDMEILRNLQPE